MGYGGIQVAMMCQRGLISRDVAREFQEWLGGESHIEASKMVTEQAGNNSNPSRHLHRRNLHHRHVATDSHDGLPKRELHQQRCHSQNRSRVAVAYPHASRTCTDVPEKQRRETLAVQILSQPSFPFFGKHPIGENPTK